MLWRQGDLYIERVSAVPAEAVRLSHLVLADGELTGHRHRIDDLNCAIQFELRENRFLEVTSDQADLVHDEHGAIRLDRGIYRVWRQREFDPAPRQRHSLAPSRASHRIVMD
jgi:hypothetical protein